jgi:MinD-like ATPase involved in chromosome partitioning or flagellar assembly
MPILDPSQFKESGLDSTTITRAQTNSGVRYVVPKTIAFTNYAGGVGKTTLSLSVSKAFRKVTGLGVAIIEAGVGASSIGPRIGSPDIPSLYQTIAIDGEPAKWQNVSLYPLSMRESQAIIGDQRAEEYIRKIRRDNTLTIFDASPLSPLWPTIVEIADEIIVLTTPRMDTVAQAETTYAEAVQMIMGMNLNKKPKMVMNMATSLTDRISMWSQLAATIPMNENAAANYSEELAAPILEVLYPGLGKATKKLPKEHKKSKENAEE